MHGSGAEVKTITRTRDGHEEREVRTLLGVRHEFVRAFDRAGELVSEQVTMG